MPALPIQFKNLNGAGIKVGVVDAGIDASHPALEQCIHKSVSLLNANRLHDSETSSPLTPPANVNGHGTAIAYIIHKKAPAAHIYSIKILDERLTSSIRRMIEAIDWAIGQNLDIINLSMGSTQFRYKAEVEAAIHRASVNNLLVVSACNSHQKPSLPASLSGVFGVSGGSLHGKYSYYWEQENHRFIARGDHQRVAGLMGKYYFGFGSSYAAPHLTGIIALIRQCMPRATYSEVLDCLISNSLTSKPHYKIDQLYSLGIPSRDIHMVALKAQQQVNNELAPTRTDGLTDSVKTIVADALKLNDEDSRRLYSITLLDPRFGLNREVAMKIIETLQVKFDLRIDDEDLFLDDFFSLGSLVAAVRRWQRTSIQYTPPISANSVELNRK